MTGLPRRRRGRVAHLTTLLCVSLSPARALRVRSSPNAYRRGVAVALRATASEDMSQATAVSPDKRSQEDTPFVEALAEAERDVRVRLFLPGHMGRAVPRVLLDRLGLGGLSRHCTDDDDDDEHDQEKPGQEMFDARGNDARDGARRQQLHRHQRSSARWPWRFDFPEGLADIDTSPGASSGPLHDAQALAAEAFGAERSWFLTNGATSGVIAAIVACVRRFHHTQDTTQDTTQGRTQGAVPGASSPEDHAPGAGSRDSHDAHDATPPIVILPRNAHSSALHALVISGAVPLYLDPISISISLSDGDDGDDGDDDDDDDDDDDGIDDDDGVVGVPLVPPMPPPGVLGGVDVLSALPAALAAAGGAERVACVLLVSPTYQGNVPREACRVASAPRQLLVVTCGCGGRRSRCVVLYCVVLHCTHSYAYLCGTPPRHPATPLSLHPSIPPPPPY